MNVPKGEQVEAGLVNNKDRIEDENAEIVRVVDKAIEGPSQTLVPGRFLVDYVPLLRYVPAWVPGAGFQRQFAEWRDASRKLKDYPYEQRNTAFVSLPPSRA